MSVAFNAIEEVATLFKDSKALLKQTTLERISKAIAESKYHDQEQLYVDESTQVEHTFEVVYPNTHAYSAISMTYATAEYWLEHLTRAVQQERSLAANSKDFSGDAVHRVVKFAKVFGLQPVPEALVSHLTETEQLRHCIMHATGRVSDSRDRKNLENMVSRNIGITIDETGRLQFTIDAAIAIVDKTGKGVADLFKLWDFGPSLPSKP